MKRNVISIKQYFTLNRSGKPPYADRTFALMTGSLMEGKSFLSSASLIWKFFRRKCSFAVKSKVHFVPEVGFFFRRIKTVV